MCGVFSEKLFLLSFLLSEIAGPLPTNASVLNLPTPSLKFKLFNLGQQKNAESSRRMFEEWKSISSSKEHFSNAKDFIAKREAPAVIPNDGKQTPTKGHPVFKAQHATATCCRECIRKWHKMQPGRELSEVQQDYLVDVIMTWIQKEMEAYEHRTNRN